MLSSYFTLDSSAKRRKSKSASDYSTFFHFFLTRSRISFIYRSIKPVAINATKLNYSVLSGRNQWNRCGNLRYRQNLLENGQAQLNAVGFRGYAMLIGRVVRGALKLRYILLGGAVTGTVTMNKVSFFSPMTHILTVNICRNTRSGRTDCRT
jgi:hypothetical protein